jgi:hypothetical protein
MGEKAYLAIKMKFDCRVRLEFHCATITSDAGLLAARELAEALGLTRLAGEALQESRTGAPPGAAAPESVYSRLAGYEDTNDADRLAQDPAIRTIAGWRDGDRPAASTNTMSRFETEVLTQKKNLEGLTHMNTQWVNQAMTHTTHRRVTLGMNSSESPVHGDQEGAAYNGHFKCTCYHPLFLFNQFGDCEGALLRPGNVHSADRWREVLEPSVEKYRVQGIRVLFRGDAAFAKPELYEFLEARGVGYSIRLPRNGILEGHIDHLLKGPEGELPAKPIVRYHQFTYRAGSWAHAQAQNPLAGKSYPYSLTIKTVAERSRRGE